MNIITAFIETRSWELLEGKRNIHGIGWDQLLSWIFVYIGPLFLFWIMILFFTDQEIFQAYVKVSYWRSANAEG